MGKINKLDVPFHQIMRVPNDYLQKRISSGAKTLCASIYKLCQVEGFTRFKVDTYIEQMDISRATYFRYLKELKDHKIIHVKQQGDGNLPFYYPLHIFFINRIVESSPEKLPYMRSITHPLEYEIETSGVSLVRLLKFSGVSYLRLLNFQGSHVRDCCSLYMIIKILHTQISSVGSVVNLKTAPRTLACADASHGEMAKNDTDQIMNKQVNGPNYENVVESTRQILPADKKDCQPLSQLIDKQFKILCDAYHPDHIGSINAARSEFIKIIKNAENPEELAEIIISGAKENTRRFKLRLDKQGQCPIPPSLQRWLKEQRWNNYPSKKSEIKINPEIQKPENNKMKEEEEMRLQYTGFLVEVINKLTPEEYLALEKMALHVGKKNNTESYRTLFTDADPYGKFSKPLRNCLVHSFICENFSQCVKNSDEKGLLEKLRELRLQDIAV